jgi:cobalamin biosynthetic protein CobC
VIAPPALDHGGRLELARRRFPNAPLPFVDLSTGINPAPYPLPPIPGEWLARLPEPEALHRLQIAAARAYGATSPALVAAAPGTQALISLLPRLRRHGSVGVLSPTYAEHARAWSAAGHAVSLVTSTAALARFDCAVLCRPNNPDGRCPDQREVAGLAGALAAKSGVLVVDEAFADLEPEFDSLTPLLPHPGLIVLRSFGKAYGLAGLRLGFALASEAPAAEIRAALGPWPVSSLAIEIGQIALGDTAWRRAASAQLRGAAARLDSLLATAGLRALGGTVLFRLYGAVEAATVAERLAQTGVLVRSFPDHPEWLRFGIPGNAEGWHRLATALPWATLRCAMSR